MSARGLTLTTLISLCALAGSLLLPGAPARAAVVHEYLSQIAEVPAKGPHGEAVPLPGQIVEANGLTVDSGELYVADQSAQAESSTRLDKFNASSGAFISQFPQLSLPLFLFRQSVAVGHGTGETEVYDVGDDPSASTAKEGVVAVIGATGALQGVWKGEDTPGGGFGCFLCNGYSGGVAVDNSGNPLTKGDVYVSAPEQGVVDVFEPKAGGGEKYLTQLTGPEPEAHPEVHFQGPNGVAVSQLNGDVVVLDGEAVDVFEPTALEKYALVRRLTGTPGGPFATALDQVAVDGGNGNIYVSGNNGAGGNSVYQFNSEGVYLGRLNGTPAHVFELRGLAVDPATSHLYVGDRDPVTNIQSVDVFGPNIVVPDVTTGAASSVTHESATLNGTVNPAKAGEATCRFEWGTSPEFGKVAPCEPEGIAEGASPVGVHATLGELQPDMTYYYRLQATNKANGHTNPGEPVQDQQFTTPGPGFHGESVSNVASTSATLDASINPHNAPTTYYFQYGTSASYGAEVPTAPGASIGSGAGDEEVARHVQGLLAGTVYHYRVVMVSELKPGVLEVFDGADETFTTQPVGSELVLPDGRQWEMVSPPDKHGAAILPIGADTVIQASVNGDAIAYTSNLPTEAGPEGYANEEQVLSRRGPAGWETRDISLHHDTATGATIGQGPEYRFFSEDVSLSAVQPFGAFNPSLSAEASEQTSYLRTDYLDGNVDDPCTSSCYRPLVTGKPGYANVLAGTAFGEEGACSVNPAHSQHLICGPYLVGATPDLSHVVLSPPQGGEVSSEIKLTPDGEGGPYGLYEWAGGKLTFIGVGVFEYEVTASGVSAFAMPHHEISNDGSRVTFKGSSEGHNGLLMRDVAKGKTVQLDAVQGGPEGGKAEAAFQIASSDGSRVFFTDQKRLTADSGAKEAGAKADLYECEMIEVEGKLQCKLSDLTPRSSGESAGVEKVLGASEDGAYVYFTAEGALAEGAVRYKPNAYNLYVRHDGKTKLVAVLSGADGSNRSGLITRVSPNGEWLAFMSQQDLTGYVTRDAISGKPDLEVYLYNANAGRLVCASCNPTGARPVGSVGEARLVEGPSTWENRWLAANIPGLTPGQGSYYQSRALSDSGRLFFNSNDALVPQDVNGTEDVYEYEPPGAGNCGTSSATFSERSGGCVGLISSGTSAEESAFLDASGNGSHVFFLTEAKLAPQDYDTTLDVYDAHECTGASPCFPTPAAVPPPCDTGDACKPSPTLQPAIFGAPSSSTFSGAGNIVPSGAAQPKNLMRAQRLAHALRACRKKRGKARAVCGRRARARYAARQSRQANNASRRGGRG